MNLFWDNASTTPVCAAAVKACCEMMAEGYYNPSALYDKGLAVKRRVEDARKMLASALNIKPEMLTFVSGATEANNWVMQTGFKNKNGNIVISEGEHPSIYQPAFALKARGVDVRSVPLAPSGAIDVSAFERAVDANTSLVSVMHCSNETGSVNPLSDLVRVVRSKAPRALFHSDGVQAFGKLRTDLLYLDVDLYSISAHKIGGPKGIGALYAKRPLAALLVGGGQERGLRSGTENTPGIVGFAAAAACYHSQAPQCIDGLRRQLCAIANSRINGDPHCNSGYIVSVSFQGVKAEILQHMLSDRGICVGTGSACSSKSKDNRVLRSMGVSPSGIEGNIRISPSTETTDEEIAAGVAVIRECVETLRGKIHG